MAKVELDNHEIDLLLNALDHFMLDYDYWMTSYARNAYKAVGEKLEGGYTE